MLSVLVAGCSEDRPERAVTVGEKDELAPDPDDPPASKDEPPDAAGDKLSQAQVERALLGIKEMPSGWAVSQPDQEEDDGQTVAEPRRCQELLDDLEQSDMEAEAKAEVEFEQGGSFGTFFSMSVESFENDSDADLESIASTMTKCPKFTTVEDGEKTKFTVSALSFPNLGEQTFALHMVAETGGFTIPLDMVIVVVGHNAVTFATGGFVGMRGEELEQLARKGMQRLGRAADS